MFYGESPITCSGRPLSYDKRPGLATISEARLGHVILALAQACVLVNVNFAAGPAGPAGPAEPAGPAGTSHTKSDQEY